MDDQNTNTPQTTDNTPTEKPSRVIQPLTPDLKPTSVADSISQFTGQAQSSPQPVVNSADFNTTEQTTAPAVPQPQPAVAAPVQPVDPTLVPPQPAVPFDASKIYPTPNKDINNSSGSLEVDQTDSNNRNNDQVRLATVVAGITRYAVIQIIFSTITLIILLYALSNVFTVYSFFSNFLTEEQKTELIWRIVRTYALAGLIVVIGYAFAIYMLLARNTKNLSDVIWAVLALSAANIVYSLYLFVTVELYASAASIIGLCIQLGMFYYLFTIKRSVDMYRA